MKQVVDRGNFLFHSLLQSQRFLTNRSRVFLICFVRIDIREEFSDLVCVLTGSWNFDTAGPVVVEVTQRVG